MLYRIIMPVHEPVREPEVNVGEGSIRWMEIIQHAGRLYGVLEAILAVLPHFIHHVGVPKLVPRHGQSLVLAINLTAGLSDHHIIEYLKMP